MLKETGKLNEHFDLLYKVTTLHKALFLYLSYYGTDVEVTSANAEYDFNTIDTLCSLIKRELKQMLTDFNGPFPKEEDWDTESVAEFKSQTIAVVGEMYAVLCFIRGINISQSFTGKRTSIQDIVTFFDENPTFTFVNILKYNDFNYITLEINKM